MKQPLVSRKSDVMGGAAVFYATRVPVQTPLDYLEAGESIDALLEGFPSVARAGHRFPGENERSSQLI
jgi:uncharacterized protein (DUF433 family)